ncbi:reverse transcriptase homolog (plasmid) [Calothrix sp. NIES-4071]|nr:reverse transcriptase homolog [Calothrix sp. NIES-4071]BAZ65126.1 reverse transcriptase homolog [Calothrix sp. NIES-4105]
MCDKHQIIEEPCESKGSSTVLKSSGSREGVADFTRSAHDAQQQVAQNMKASANGISKRVIELDIEKCVRRDS